MEIVDIMEIVRSQKGNVVTSYGPDKARGNSGAAIFGGSSSDLGMPVTHDAIVNVKIPNRVVKRCRQQHKFTHNLI